MNDLREAKTVDDVSEYVQEFARYNNSRQLSKTYSVRYPMSNSGQSVFSNDTWDLVKKLCEIYEIKL